MRNVIHAVCVAAVVAALGSIAMAGPIYIESFGSLGDGDGQFQDPFGVAVDSAGNVYVADTYNNRIQKFSQSGGSMSHEWSFGSQGNADGQFDRPRDVAVDSTGAIFVLDGLNNRVQKLSQSGGSASHEWSFGSLGSGDGEFNGPLSIAVDSEGSIYVADGLNDRIQKLSQAGGGVSHEWSFGSSGSGDGEFNEPYGIAVDSSGDVYVMDHRQHRIQKLSQSGDSVSHEWSSDGGVGTEEFHSPTGVDVAPSGAVYVADDSANRVQKFLQIPGGMVREWSFGRGRGSGDGEFSSAKSVATDTNGNLYVTDGNNNRIQRWFDVDELSPGQTAIFPSLTVWSDSRLGDFLILEANKVLDVIGATTIESGGTLTLSPATLNTDRLVIASGGTLNIEGTVSGAVQCPVDGQINITGNAAMGDPNRYDGFNSECMLIAGSHTVTLHAKGFANLGIVTELGGGILVAPNGVVVGPGKSLYGSGMVNAKVSATFGSTIEATGDLALGDSNSYAGFFSDGELLTGSHTVTINDRNEAVLGSLTQLGDGVSGGTLTAGNADPADTQTHFLLEQGKNMIGRGSVNGNYKNHGHVIGEGLAPPQRIVFESGWTVTGKGTFEYVGFKGTFSPGDSPTITSTTHAWYAGGTVQVELGGTTPGSGNDNHDQINDTATVWLDHAEPPTLEILPWSNFVPEIGDEFVIMTWQTSLDGEFGAVIVDPWFTDRGIDFEPHYNNVGGVGNLTIEATPEPATLSMLALGCLALVRRRKRGMCK